LGVLAVLVSYIACRLMAVVTASMNAQWRRFHRARGHVAPTFTNGWARGDTLSRRTANKKLTKLHWPSRQRSPKRLIVLLEPKSGGARPKKICPLTFAPGR